MTEHNTHTNEQAPVSAETAAELSKSRREALAQDLSSEELDRDSVEAYTKLDDLINSALESADNGELEFSGDRGSISKKQLLEQMILSFDAQRGNLDPSIPGVRYLPGAGGIRLAFRSFLGDMAPGSEPSEHASMAEAIISDKYHKLTHPEEAVLLDVEEAPEVSEVVESIESPEAVAEEAPTEPGLETEVTPKSTPAEEEPTLEDAPQQPESAEAPEQDEIAEKQEIMGIYERQVNNVSEALGDAVDMLDKSMDGYSQAGQRYRNLIAQSQARVTELLNSVYRFNDYGLDGMRTVLNSMESEMYQMAGGLMRSSAELIDPEGGVKAATSDVAEMHSWSVNTDRNAQLELSQRGYQSEADDIDGNGAEAIRLVAEDAVGATTPVVRMAHELADAAGVDAQSVNRAINEVNEALRMSYVHDSVNSGEVEVTIRRLLADMNSSPGADRAEEFNRAIDSAASVIKAANQQIRNR